MPSELGAPGLALFATRHFRAVPGALYPIQVSFAEWGLFV